MIYGFSWDSPTCLKPALRSRWNDWFLQTPQRADWDIHLVSEVFDGCSWRQTGSSSNKQHIYIYIFPGLVFPNDHMLNAQRRISEVTSAFQTNSTKNQTQRKPKLQILRSKTFLKRPTAECSTVKRVKEIIKSRNIIRRQIETHSK